MNSHQQRKEEHLEICLNQPVGFKDVTTGFEKYYFIHQALPELDLKQIKLDITLFNKRLAAPVIISPMVGGIAQATGINRNLATAVQKLGIGMGVGSQRCFVDDPQVLTSFQVRDVAPDILLFANLGAVQLNYGFGPDECLKIVESINADALILHLNPLQEALQPEGNTDFSTLLPKIENICRQLSVPVVVKEVGCGISKDVARQLFEVGVVGLDIAGAGGTCWSKIEQLRQRDKISQNVAGHFASWGIPTAESLIMAHKGAPQLSLIASGGIRTGIDIAKAIALGAEAAGIGAPLLKPAVDSAEKVVDVLEEIIETLRITMFCIGVSDITALKLTSNLNKV